MIDAEPLPLPNGRLVSRSMDNRIGCFVAAEAARLVAADGGAPGDVLALAVAQEETTFAGARTSAFGLEPDLAIVVDVTHATDQPGVELGPVTKHKLGSGPVIARGTSLHPAVTELLLRDRRAGGACRSPSSRWGGRPGPTPTRFTPRAPASRRGWSPCRCATCTPPVELVALSDIENAAKLIAAFAKRLAPDMSFQR